MEPLILKILVVVGEVMGLAFLGYLIPRILRESEGTERMKEISQGIWQGAIAFLRREMKMQPSLERALRHKDILKA